MKVGSKFAEGIALWVARERLKSLQRFPDPEGILQLMRDCSKLNNTKLNEKVSDLYFTYVWKDEEE